MYTLIINELYQLKTRGKIKKKLRFVPGDYPDCHAQCDEEDVGNGEADDEADKDPVKPPADYFWARFHCLVAQTS